MRLGYLGNTCVVTKLPHQNKKAQYKYSMNLSAISILCEISFKLSPVSKRCKTRNLGFKDHFLVRLISHIDFETANMYLLITSECELPKMFTTLQ